MLAHLKSALRAVLLFHFVCYLISSDFNLEVSCWGMWIVNASISQASQTCTFCCNFQPPKEFSCSSSIIRNQYNLLHIFTLKCEIMTKHVYFEIHQAHSRFAFITTLLTPTKWLIFSISRYNKYVKESRPPKFKAFGPHLGTWYNDQNVSTLLKMKLLDINLPSNFWHAKIIL